MTTERYGRKLTAILSADAKGYSRLMREDEEATVRTLTAYREVIETVIEKHRGRVVDSPGDNVLAEFTSVVDAVRSAVEIQEELKARNAKLPEGRKMEFRIGVNLGDVIEDGERIYGDGVNIAARVEGLAEGGGVCISGTVYEHVKDKLAFGYESLGEHTVKNIAEPVRVYRGSGWRRMNEYILKHAGNRYPTLQGKKGISRTFTIRRCWTNPLSWITRYERQGLFPSPFPDLPLAHGH